MAGMAGVIDLEDGAFFAGVEAPGVAPVVGFSDPDVAQSDCSTFPPDLQIASSASRAAI